MPRFFFNHYSPGLVMKDDVGCDFDSYELAYLEAFRGMVDIGAELIRNGEDPGPHRIEIVTPNGEVLDELRFDEIFRRRPAYPASSRPLQAEIQLNRRLRAEMWEACRMAKDLVTATRETMRRTADDEVLQRVSLTQKGS